MCVCGGERMIWNSIERSTDVTTAHSPSVASSLPLPAAFLFIYQSFAYSLHLLCGWIRCGLASFGLLLTWVSAGGAYRWRILLRRQPIWACGGKINVKYEAESETSLYNSQGSWNWNQEVMLAMKEPARRRNSDS